MSSEKKQSFAKKVDHVEESFIALLLGAMTLITFANVVARYAFNDNLLWALEVTVFLFAWLVLIGMSYCVKKGIHLGVDVIVNMVSRKNKRLMALAAVSACLLFSLLLLKGSWDYWYPFATSRAFLETNDVPMPDFLQFFADWLNEGERYEKLPRFIPYAALPIGMALLTYRLAQAAWLIYTGKVHLIIASHEVDEADEMLTAQPKREA